jgi:hypothetical protein
MTLAQNLQAILSFFIQLFVIFPYSVLTIPRHGPLRLPKRIGAKPSRANETKRGSGSTMVSDRLYKLCTGKESVSALLADDPNLAPGDAWKKLYGSHLPRSMTAGGSNRDSDKHSINVEDLKRVAECGNWGTAQPSELFLKVSTFHRF